MKHRLFFTTLISAVCSLNAVAQAPVVSTAASPAWYYIQVSGEGATVGRMATEDGDRVIGQSPLSGSLSATSKQLWRFEKNGDNVDVISKSSGKKMSAAYDDAKGVRVVTLTDASSITWKWYNFATGFNIRIMSEPTGGTAGDVHLCQSTDGDGALVFTNSANNQTKNATWKFSTIDKPLVSDGTDTYWFFLESGKTGNAGKFLTDVVSANKDVKFALKAKDATNNSHQQWKLVKHGTNGSVDIVNRATGNVIKTEALLKKFYYYAQAATDVAGSTGWAYKAIGNDQYEISTASASGVTSCWSATADGDAPAAFSNDKNSNTSFAWIFRYADEGNAATPPAPATDVDASTPFLGLVPTMGLASTLPLDTYISPSGAWASSVNGSEPISRSYDRSMSTLYHSAYNGTTYPITLRYYFDGTKNIDYLVYYPRTEGTNGLFKEVEVWYSLKDDNVPMVKHGDFNFQASSLPSTVTFTPALAIDTIQFVVKSSQSDAGRAFASCAEMEFYSKNAGAVDYTTFFTDKSYSALKPTVTEAVLATIDNPFFADLAAKLYYKQVEHPEFRVQEYDAYVSPEVMASALKIARYGRNDNPTGVYVGAGDEVVICVGETDGTVPTLFVQRPKDLIAGTSYALSEGVNVIKPSHEGLMYIRYYTPTGTENPVKINIINGTVNGYFDSNKHTADDWAPLLAAATYSNFDVKGKLVSMNFETQAFRTYTKNDGFALIQMYDSLAWLEQELMGLFKYNRAYRNHVHMQVGYGNVYMDATDYRTAYGFATQSTLLSLEKFANFNHNPTYREDTWGQAHEIGHVNQVRPAMKWAGMTEITNNIYSAYVQTSFGNDCRLNYGGAYDDGKNYIIKFNTDANPSNDVAINSYRAEHKISHHFVLTASFWQLQLYMANVLGNKDFYPDIFEEVRKVDYGSHSDFPTDGFYQMNFVKLACKHSGLDLTEYFQAWGYLTPIDQDIDDYSTSRFTITQAQIDAVKAEIAAMGLHQPILPAGKKLYEITDSNWQEYIVDGTAIPDVETADDDIKIYPQAGRLYVETQTAQAVKIYTLLGVQVYNKVVQGTESIALAKGVYIVQAGKKVEKVILL
ncbi:hypothetical protein AGMMS49965_01120 [Bacteroidia bacterium]|nr:hypothetical protein AGMMS49965_01120 [Bacteroidia bacterium]